jgi:hypothetical protein
MGFSLVSEGLGREEVAMERARIITILLIALSHPAPAFPVGG